MFVLDELDKILQNLTSPTRRDRKVDQFRVSLRDVDQLDMEQMQLALKVRYPPPLSGSTIGAPVPKAAINLNELVEDDDEKPSMDKVFSQLVYNLIMTKLMVMPERHYPSARLIICDWSCYEIIMRFKRISSATLSNSTPKNINRLRGLLSGKNIIYRKPFGVTAIFLLSDIVDIFNRQNDSLIVNRLDRSTGKTIIAYNTGLIKQTFPYLKMSDLLILLQDKKQLDLGNLNMKSSREHQILQFLNHFARSTELIEFNWGIYRILSKLHPIYDNVLVVANNDSDNAILFNKLQLPQMSLMVQQLLQLTDLLRLNIISITHRQADVSYQTKMFAQLLSTSLKSKQNNQSMGSLRRVKVLVLDRFHDLSSVMSHANKYGAYLEQEKQFGSSYNALSNKLRVENLDELDEQLQLVPLTDVLSSILKFTISLKSIEVDNNRLKDNSRLSDLASNAITTRQSIRRHLELVKSMYKSLNEGYLLMLRLEMSLENIGQRLKDPSLDERQVEELDQQLERVLSTFKQLINVPSNAIKVSDLVRIACMLLDVGNIFMFVVKQRNNTKLSLKAGTIQEVLDGKDFERVIESKQHDSGGGGKEEEMEKKEEMENFKEVRRKLIKFDKLSREFCPQKSLLSLRQMVEKFHQNQLDPESFPTLDLLEQKSPQGNSNNLIILAFLGSITAHELSRIKSLGASKRLYLITYNLLEPADFLRAL